MTTRRFCDRCDEQITHKDYGKATTFTQVERRFKVQITIAVDGTFNGGNICAPCLGTIVQLSINKDAVS